MSAFKAAADPHREGEETPSSFTEGPLRFCRLPLATVREGLSLEPSPGLAGLHP